jgi:hypothetical protein
MFGKQYDFENDEFWGRIMKYHVEVWNLFLSEAVEAS